MILASALTLASLVSCGSVLPAAKMVLNGGEKQLKPRPKVPSVGPRVLVFALDGTGCDQLTEAIRSGKAPNLAGLLGKDEGGGIHEHAYSAPDAYAIFPTITIAAWSSIFTGSPTAYNGVPGDEWFVREEMKFYAPIPISVPDKSDTLKMITDDLVGKQLKTRTVQPTALLAMFADVLAGTVQGKPDTPDVFAKMDRDSIPKLIESMNAHGVPRLQVVYFPGIDLYTHVAPGDPLQQQTEYLEKVTDPLIGQVLHAYQGYGVLNETYVVIVADHGHTPVHNDFRHALGMAPDASSAELRAAGFRTRPFVLDPPANQQDYQAVLAYEDATAYVYLADRSTCPKPGDKCDWKRPPRFKQDVMPVARALFRADRTGAGSPRLKGALDLIFARVPSRPGEPAKEFEVFDGRRLIPIYEYLEKHPRPDLPELDRRMRWLSAGPYGNRAGDILLLAKSGLNRPIEDRFYFSPFYHSIHGSGSMQDTHIPLILAHQGCSGARLKTLMKRGAGQKLSHLDVTPLILTLLSQDPEHDVCTGKARVSEARPAQAHVEGH